MKSHYSIIMLPVVMACFLSPLEAVTPREALETARTASSPAESIRILEQALPGSADLRPWVLLDLARAYGDAGSWDSSLVKSRELEKSGIPAEIADSAAWWLGEALSRTGKTDDASRVYLSRIKTGAVRDTAVYLAFFRISSHDTETALVLLDKTYPELKKTDPETFGISRYLAGLSAVREGNWQLAFDALSAFSPTFYRTFPDYAPWSQYYLAFSLYRLGRWSDAVAAFSRYLDTWKDQPRSWQAATSAALSAMQCDADPLPYAARAVSLAPAGEDRAASIILHASILTDRKQYADASKLLSGVADGSATAGLTSQASRAVFSLGEIAARERDFPGAEEYWLSLNKRFPKEPLAEEGLYRAGEQWYVAGDWNRSASLFAQYRQLWPRGRFLETVLRSGGEAYVRAGNPDLSILWWEDLLVKFPASPSAPRTRADLVALYRKKGEYGTALKEARDYLKLFPSESGRDDISREIAELEILAAGGDAGTAALEASWRDAGKAKTAEGRSIGVHLARLYLEDYSKRSTAKAVLLDITGKAPKSADALSAGDRSVFGAAWALLGSIYRESNDFRNASQALLAAGTMYAAIDADRAAESLYGASDAFLQSGLRADAEKTAETLKAAWPSSVWSGRASRLLE